VACKRGRAPAARIRHTFGHRKLGSITTAEINRFLAELDEQPTIGPRSVNKYRQVMASVFEHAMRPDTFNLATNRCARPTSPANPTNAPSSSTSPRRSSPWPPPYGTGCIAIRRPAVTPEEVAERRRADEQDAALFLVAAFTGLHGRVVGLALAQRPLPRREAARRGQLVGGAPVVAEVA
jgi:hypothetical protein